MKEIFFYHEDCRAYTPQHFINKEQEVITKFLKRGNKTKEREREKTIQNCKKERKLQTKKEKMLQRVWIFKEAENQSILVDHPCIWPSSCVIVE